jgi:hypothetical protein
MNVSSTQHVSRPSDHRVLGYSPFVLPNEVRFVQHTLDGDTVVRVFVGSDLRIMAYFEHFVGSTIEREPVSLYKSELDSLCEFARSARP